MKNWITYHNEKRNIMPCFAYNIINITTRIIEDKTEGKEKEAMLGIL